MRYFDIAWCSGNDGPGSRVVVFLQGCGLRCEWCHSPHSWRARGEVLFFDEYCRHCGKCVEACPTAAHGDGDDGRFVRRDVCGLCGRCVQVCAHGALELKVREESPELLFERVRAELAMLRGIGGVTLSGGEPLLQWHEAAVFLRLCRREGVHTAVETAGAVSGEAVAGLEELVDCWLFGLKVADPERCLRLTGADIGVVLGNLARLAGGHADRILVRTPLIPGATDSEENLRGIADIMLCHGLDRIDLLPFNPHTDHYYRAIGRERAIVDKGHGLGVAEARKVFNDCGIEVIND